MRSGGELRIKLTVCVEGLDVRISSDVFSADEHIGDCALTSLLCKGGLDVAAVGCGVELNEFELDALLREQLLGGAGEGAVRLRVDNDLVAGDVRVDFVNQRLGHFVCVCFADSI